MLQCPAWLSGVDAKQYGIVPQPMQHGHLLAEGAYGLAFEIIPGGTGWAWFAQRLPNSRRLHPYGVRRIGDSVFIAGDQGLLPRFDVRGGTLLVFGLRGTPFRSGELGGNCSAVASGAPVSIRVGSACDGGSLLLAGLRGLKRMEIT